MKYSLYIDESGDHILKADKDYPIFILGGVLLSEVEHNKLTKLLSNLKIKYFSRANMILHTAEFLRAKSINSVYYPLCNAANRKNFYNDLENLVRNIDFKIIAAAVSKPDYLKHYQESAQDPYLLAVKPLAENACAIYQELGLNEPINFIAESRNKKLDNQLQANYQFLNLSGIKIARAIRFHKPVKKEDNIAGLQLADLVVTPLGRNLLRRKQYLNFDSIAGKIKSLSRLPVDWLALEQQLALRQ
jgi:hypothetical protein